MPQCCVPVQNLAHTYTHAHANMHTQNTEIYKSLDNYVNKSSHMLLDDFCFLFLSPLFYSFD